MKLKSLLAAVEPLEIAGPADPDVAGLACDSRVVAAGTLFFALPGVKVDGCDYIPQAIAGGATAVVAERFPESLEASVCYIRVASARRAMALMANRFYGDPSQGIPVIGVTGTNGKTTVTYLLEAILKCRGLSPAVFGTVEYRFGDERRAASHTTPESIELLRLLRDFRDLGADALIMEVSSHALEQHRVDGIHFDLAIFTNLTSEHLDYHLDMERYFASKKRLFTELLEGGVAVVNREDAYGVRLLEECGGVSFGLDERADLFPEQISVGRTGIQGNFSGQDEAVRIDSGLIGDFNVSNLLAAVAAARQLGIDPSVIAEGIRAMAQVPGRVERVKNRKGVLALVDYAHTGDALEQVLKTLSKLEHRRLLCLVGCGGDRDPGKRPVMAAIAVNYANLAVFTSDNPRTEDPLRILEQIRVGALQAGGVELSEQDAAGGRDGFVMIPDRRAAIAFACSLAGEGDLLLVAGKGHEDYQILGTEKIHFDDREELDRFLNQSAGADGGRHV